MTCLCNVMCVAGSDDVINVGGDGSDRSLWYFVAPPKVHPSFSSSLIIISSATLFLIIIAYTLLYP